MGRKKQCIVHQQMDHKGAGVTQSYSQQAPESEALPPLPAELLELGQRWMSQGEVHDLLVTYAQNPKSKRAPVGGDFEINMEVRSILLKSVRCGMSDAHFDDASMEQERHALIQHLSRMKYNSEEWRGYSFVYHPNVSLDLDMILDPTLPYAPAHIRNMFGSVDGV